MMYRFHLEFPINFLRVGSAILLSNFIVFLFVCCGGGGSAPQQNGTLDPDLYPPTNLEASQGTSADSISLQWSPPENLVVDGYQLERAFAPYTSFEVIASVDSSVTEYSDQLSQSNPLPYAVPVSYRIRSLRGDTYGPSSVIAEGFRVLASVNTLSASNGWFFDHVSLEWSPVAGANGYALEYLVETPTPGEWLELVTLDSGDTSSYNHTLGSGDDPATGVLYKYRIKAKLGTDLSPDWTESASGFLAGGVGKGDWYTFARNGDHSTASTFLGPSSGEVDWQVTINPEAYIHQPITMDNRGFIYVVASDGSLTAVDAETGSFIWQKHPGGDLDTAATVADDGSLHVAGRGGYVYSINALDGSKKWEAHVDGENFMLSAPCVDSDYTSYLGGGATGRLYAFSSLGQLLWTSEPLGQSVNASPIVSGTNVICGGEQSIAAVNKVTGAIIWRYDLEEAVSPTASLGPDGSVYFACWDKFVYSLDSNGLLNWRTDVAIEITSGPSYVDGTLYCGSIEGEVIALSANGSGELWRTTQRDEIIDAWPIVASNGNLFVAWRDGLVSKLNPQGETIWQKQLSAGGGLSYAFLLSSENQLCLADYSGSLLAVK